MIELYDYSDGALLTPYCCVKKTQQVNRIYSKAIDGTAYIQIIGNPTIEYTVSCVLSLNLVEKLEKIESSGAALMFKNKTETIIGRIVSDISFGRTLNNRCVVKFRVAKEDFES